MAFMHCNIYFVSYAHFLKQLYLFAANARRSPPFFVHMHGKNLIAIYSLLRATPSDLLLLQEFYPCSMLGNIQVQQIYSLHKVSLPIQATFSFLQAYG